MVLMANVRQTPPLAGRPSTPAAAGWQAVGLVR
ncbi:MAG: hypothetical protein N838_31535 [Thiohalocapsa sp. PB-PSB1]|nr:MAG: hypothetical protein N838_31535 [Thiohalocapsa sp. PB-PSB1]